MTIQRTALVAVGLVLAASCGTTDRALRVEEPSVSLFDDDVSSSADPVDSEPGSPDAQTASAVLVIETLPAPRSGAAGVVVVDDVLMTVEVDEDGRNVVVGSCALQTLVEQEPRRDFLVVLDPIGDPDGFDVVEPIVALTADRLNAAGVATAVTRRAVVEVAARTRADAAVASGARLLVSLGVREAGDKTALGPEPAVDVFHQIDSSESRRFGGLLHQSLESVLKAHDVSWSTGAETGVRPLLNQRGTDFYTMLRDTEQLDSVVVFLGGLTSDAESLLRSPTGRSELADALVDAVVQQFMTDEAGSGYIQPSETVRTAPTANGAVECGSAAE